MLFLTNILDFLINLTSYEYTGVFITSLIGSAIPFIPLPYFVVIVLASQFLDPLIIGIVAGLGASLGKMTSYFLGRSGYRLSAPETKRNLDTLRGVVGKYGFLGVFLFAVTPLPDDLYIIPMGMMKFSFIKLLLATIAGKVTLSIIISYTSRSYLNATSLFIDDSQLIVIVATIIATLLLTTYLFKADWKLALEIYSKKGPLGLLSSLPLILSRKKKTHLSD
jgi:membrane protein YqaA with SNARE-associated domain